MSADVGAPEKGKGPTRSEVEEAHRKAETIGSGFETAAAILKRREDEDLALAVEAAGGSITPAQVRVLKNTVCAKFTVPQLQLYLTICSRKGVDPFTEAYGFPNSEGGLAFGLRIDGMRALAMRTGDYVRREVELLVVPDGDRKGEIYGAVARIWRKGMEAPVVEEALFSEYKAPGKGFGWTQYPETMIRKVAESKALRAAFPDALSGVYEPSEIGEHGTD
jgi:hypothetical protein